MSRRSTAESGEIQRLRREIADDLIALRQLAGRCPSWSPQVVAGDLPAQVGRMVRANPAWVVGAIAGVIAALWMTLRRSVRESTPPGDPPSQTP